MIQDAGRGVQCGACGHGLSLLSAGVGTLSGEARYCPRCATYVESVRTEPVPPGERRGGLKAAASLTPREINDLRRKNREIVAYAQALVQRVRLSVAAVDTIMIEGNAPGADDPQANFERGRALARIMNDLQMDVDRLDHFGLDQALGRSS